MTWDKILKRKKYRGKRYPKSKICLHPNKRRYDSWGHAHKDAKKISKQTGVSLRVYSCGNHFHITKNPHK